MRKIKEQRREHSNQELQPSTLVQHDHGTKRWTKNESEQRRKQRHKTTETAVNQDF